MSMTLETKFQTDVAYIIPIRERFLAMTPKERQTETDGIMSNTKCRIIMKPSEPDTYWPTVIKEADRRINSAKEASE